jgi:hypothetical protein
MGLLIVSATLVDPSNGTEVVYLIVAGLIVSFVSKSSNLLVVVSSGIDHGRWLERVQTVSELGTIVGGDMYEASPLYILELSIPYIIFGNEISVTTTRFITIFISVMFPIIVYTVVKNITGSRKLSLIGFALAIPQPLLFRTAMLLESEILAIVWYSISLLSFIAAIRTQQTRWVLITSLFVTSSILLHFFYGFIIISTIFSLFVAITVLMKLPIFENMTSSSIVLKRTLGYFLAFSLIFAPFWVFGSIYRGEAISVLYSALSIGDGSIFSITPTEGSAASGTGSSNSSNSDLRRILLRYSSIIGFMILGTIGGLKCLTSKRWQEVALAISSVMILLLTIVTVTAGLEFRLGFRLYYYVILCLLFLSPIGVNNVLGMFRRQNWASAIRSLLLLVVILGIVLSAPVSPLSNNIDPVAGGEKWYILPAESQASETMDQYVHGNVPWSTDVVQHSEYFRPHSSEGDPTRMTRGYCNGFELRIYDNNYLRACR